MGSSVEQLGGRGCRSPRLKGAGPVSRAFFIPHSPPRDEEPGPGPLHRTREAGQGLWDGGTDPPGRLVHPSWEALTFTLF